MNNKSNNVVSILSRYIEWYPNCSIYITLNKINHKLFITIIDETYSFKSIFNKRHGTQVFEDYDIKGMMSTSDYSTLYKIMQRIPNSIKNEIVGIHLEFVDNLLINNKVFQDTINTKTYNFSLEPVEVFLTDIPGEPFQSELRFNQLRRALVSLSYNDPVLKEAYYNLLPNFIGTDHYIIPYKKNRKKIIKIEYAPLNKKNDYYACISTSYLSRTSKSKTVIAPITEPEMKLMMSANILLMPTLVISTIIAHELTHAVRALNMSYSSLMYGYSNFWMKIEEFLADRGIKHQLPFVNEMYKNKKNRQLALALSHKYLNHRGWHTLGTPITKIAEFRDRLVAFY